jgi:hypothetical protein
MKSNNKPESQRDVKDKKKPTTGTAAHDGAGLEGPKNPIKADPIAERVIATPDGTLEQPKRPS